MNFPSPKIGEQVRRYIDERLRKFLTSERIISGSGIIIKQTATGKTVSAIPYPPQSAFVRIKGKKYTIGGSRARYIWIYYTENPVRAEWSSIDQDPMPDGVEIVDTHVQEFHIPRVG